MPTILLRLAPYTIVISILIGAYFWVNNILEENQALKQDNVTLKQNLQEEKSQCEKKLKVKEVVVKWKTKKVYIEKQIKKDTDEEAKVDTKPTNRFYLD